MERMDGYDKIDRILSREDEILPSSGFAVSVMNAVRQEAAAPPPIPFPWKRALPGLVAAGLALLLIPTMIVVAMVRRVGIPATAHGSVSIPSMFPSLLQPNLEGALIWVALASLVAFLSTKLSMRLASGAL
jgi:hypothetical protein